MSLWRLLLDDPDFGMKAGDVLECRPYRWDPDKLTVVQRVRDGYDPRCNVYRSQVRALQDADWRRRWMNRGHCGGAVDRVCPGGCPCSACGC